jgi:hypothetical protein
MGGTAALCASLAVASVKPAAAINISVFGTGLTSTGALAAQGAVDQNWAVNGSSAYVASSLGGGWTNNTSTSQWIAPSANAGAGYPVTTYDYIQSFNLASGINLSKVTIRGQFSVDDWATVKVNGVQVANFPAGTWSSWNSFTLNASNSTFVSGLNTIEFDVNNSGGGASGLQVQIQSATADVVNAPEPASLTLLTASLLAGGAFKRRRRRVG